MKPKTEFLPEGDVTFGYLLSQNNTMIHNDTSGKIHKQVYQTNKWIKTESNTHNCLSDCQCQIEILCLGVNYLH